MHCTHTQAMLYNCVLKMNPVQFNSLYISLFSSFCLLMFMIVTGQLPMMERIRNLGSLRSAELLSHKLPSVIVIGVKKCGTGAVMQQLGIHPQVSVSIIITVTIVISPGGVSEIWHGGEQTLGPEVVQGKGDSAFYREYGRILTMKTMRLYQEQMPLSYPDQQVITKSPGVLQFPGNITFLQMLRDEIPDIKLLFVVKDPVQRIIGDIIHEFKSGFYRSAFEEL